MNTHKNASLMPKERAHLVAQIALIDLKLAAQTTCTVPVPPTSGSAALITQALAACLTAGVRTLLQHIDLMLYENPRH